MHLCNVLCYFVINTVISLNNTMLLLQYLEAVTAELLHNNLCISSKHDATLSLHLNVFFNILVDGPRSLSVSPRDGRYSPGSKIQVSADSNPSPPRYKWVDTDTGKTVARGHILTITDDMLGRKTLKVVACNTILVPPFPEKCAELTLTISCKCNLNSIYLR